jgi:hypothetical protein
MDINKHFFKCTKNNCGSSHETKPNRLPQNTTDDKSMAPAPKFVVVDSLQRFGLNIKLVCCFDKYPIFINCRIPLFQTSIPSLLIAVFWRG